MWRSGLRQVGGLALGLVGAVLLAGTISAFSASTPTAPTFAREVVARLSAMAHLDFGASVVTALPASVELARRLPATLELLGLGLLISLFVGIPLGLVLSAGRVLRASALLMQIIAAAPVFCVGLGLLWLSARLLHWSGGPRAISFAAALASGRGDIVASELRNAALPALTVGAAGAGAVQLALRRAVSQAASAPYRRGLRAMGLSRFEIDRVYLVPQVASALLRSAGEIVSSLLAAVAVAEWVFRWPGAAELFLKSVALDDWTVAGLILLLFAGLTMTVEFLGAIAALFLAEGIS